MHAAQNHMEIPANEARKGSVQNKHRERRGDKRSAAAGALIKTKRRQRGSAIAEMGPALFLLIVCAVFPIIDVIYGSLTYCACMAINDAEVREASKVPSVQAFDTVSSILSDWQATGLGQSIGFTEQPTINISYPNSQYVVVATRFSVKPLVPIPFFVGIPGLATPIAYTIADKKLLESPSYAPPIN